MLQIPRSSRVLAVLAAVLLVALRGEPTRGAEDAPPAVELIETVPIQSTLGNPDLKAAAPTWVALIRGATRSLDLEQFYLSNRRGEPLEPVLDAIVEAAKRGVAVRLLLDARMYESYPMPADSLGRVPGITVRQISMGKIAGGVQHAKYFIVDGRIVFIGSQNFDWRALKHIHELGVLIRDTRAASMYQQVFELDWAAAEIQATRADSGQMIAWPAAEAIIRDLPVKLAQAPGDSAELWPSWSPRRFSPDSALWDLDAIVRRIEASRNEIVAQVLQYSVEDRGLRDDSIDAALRRAAGRGVRVRLMVSDWEAGRDGMKAIEALSLVPGIQIKMSRVPEWSGGYIPFARVEHCKYMVVDTLWTWLGTSNWEPSYFHRSRNMAATLRHRGIAAEARRVFQASWDDSAARTIGPRVSLPPREHGMEPPPGVRVYGE